MRSLAEQAAEELADAPEEEVIRWAADTFGERICITSSMIDAVIIHLVSAVKPGINVVFLDAGYHFAETIGPGTPSGMGTRSNLVNVNPSRTVAEQDAELGPRLYGRNPDLCCYLRKVEPLEKSLGAVRRVVHRRAPRGDRVPAAGHPRRGVGREAADHQGQPDRGLDRRSRSTTTSPRNGVLVNPLVYDGYPSIGCRTCTMRVEGGRGPPRSGRWAGAGQDRMRHPRLTLGVRSHPLAVAHGGRRTRGRRPPSVSCSAGGGVAGGGRSRRRGGRGRCRPRSSTIAHHLLPQVLGALRNGVGDITGTLNGGLRALGYRRAAAADRRVRRVGHSRASSRPRAARSAAAPRLTSARRQHPRAAPAAAGRPGAAPAARPGSRLGTRPPTALALPWCSRRRARPMPGRQRDDRRPGGRLAAPSPGLAGGECPRTRRPSGPRPPRPSRTPDTGQGPVEWGGHVPARARLLRGQDPVGLGQGGRVRRLRRCSAPRPRWPTSCSPDT